MTQEPGGIDQTDPKYPRSWPRTNNPRSWPRTNYCDRNADMLQ
ncbi:MAG TPA: hypothetical protein PLQ04_10740 [Lachnospiraceae bacterium]|nr:hypothetical protein [Lachnospiraceae bacterium]